MPPVLVQTRPPPLDKYYPMGRRESSTNKQHNLHDPNSLTIVRCLQIWDWRINYKGMAWLWRIHPEWHGIITLNLLELITSATSIYMTIQQLGQGSHILDFTYSLSALGWMQRVSFDPVNEESHDIFAW